MTQETPQDLVGQLRFVASKGMAQTWDAEILCNAAADEIERMRTALQRIAAGDYNDLAGNPALWASQIAKDAITT